MKRRAFLAAIPALAITPPTTAKFNGPIWRAMQERRERLGQQRELYRHFYNQDLIVNRAISLHAEFQLSSLT